MTISADLLEGSDRTRWNLLLKTSKHHLEALSEDSFVHESYSMTGKEESTLHLLQELQEMITDMQAIVKDSRTKVIPSPPVPRVVTSSEQEIFSEAACRFTIPIPAPVADLRDFTNKLKIAEDKLSALTSRSSAKQHRLLLEEVTTLRTRQTRTRQQIDNLQSEIQGKDLLSISTAQELVYGAVEIMSYTGDKTEVKHYLRNSLVHAVILSVIEASFESERRSRVQSMIEQILNMLFITQSLVSKIQGRDDLSDVLTGALGHLACRRLPISSLLSGTVKYHYESMEGLKPVPTKEKPTKVARSSTNYWLLTQTHVSDRELLVDSYALKPKATDEPDARGHTSLSSVLISADEENSEQEIVHEQKAEAARNLEETQITDHEVKLDDDDDDEYMRAFPSVPTIAPRLDNLDRDNGGEEIDESEAQRLITLFGPTKESSDSSESEIDDEPDYSELIDLSAAEQEEVLRALASAREHHNVKESLDESALADLMKEARDALHQFEIDSEVAAAKSDAVSPDHDDDGASTQT